MVQWHENKFESGPENPSLSKYSHNCPRITEGWNEKCSYPGDIA